MNKDNIFKTIMDLINSETEIEKDDTTEIEKDDTTEVEKDDKTEVEKDDKTEVEITSTLSNLTNRIILIENEFKAFKKDYINNALTNSNDVNEKKEISNTDIYTTEDIIK